jgi:hypothetical protein
MKVHTEASKIAAFWKEVSKAGLKLSAQQSTKIGAQTVANLYYADQDGEIHGCYTITMGLKGGCQAKGVVYKLPKAKENLFGLAWKLAKMESRSLRSDSGYVIAVPGPIPPMPARLHNLSSPRKSASSGLMRMMR